MRRLNLSTDRIPFTPKFQANFHKQRLSVVRRMRVAREATMITSGRRPTATGNSGAFINPAFAFEMLVRRDPVGGFGDGAHAWLDSNFSEIDRTPGSPRQLHKKPSKRS